MVSLEYGAQGRIDIFGKSLGIKLYVLDNSTTPVAVCATEKGRIKESRLSEMTDRSIDVPLDRNLKSSEIPVTYVPARNTIFLSYALALAESIGAFDIFIGVNATDYSGYPDCRGEYIKAFEKMANLATAAAIRKKGRYEIHTPIIKMTKAQIIKTGTRLGVDYSLTHSCYNPNKAGKPCGRCDSCRLRLRGFAQAGLKDPLKYAKR